MAEDSYLWNTNGTGDGDNAGITMAQMQQMFRALFAGHLANLGGVVPDYLNELAVSGSATPVSVASGAAVSYGLMYHNSSAVSVAVPTPAAATRVDRIVLRVDWAAQTVRVTRVAGTEGAGAPSLTQNAGTTWDIPLATVSITTGGVITVTDAREWLGIIADGAISAAKLADGAALAEILDDDGAGSGLDADKLDGSEAAAFATSGHNHTLDGLSNVSMAGKDAGDFVKWDGSAWVPDLPAAVGFNDAEGNPANVAQSAADGTSAYAARREHVHAVGTQVIQYQHLGYGYSPPMVMRVPAANQDFGAGGAVLDISVSHKDYDQANIFTVASNILTCSVAALLEFHLTGYLGLASGAGANTLYVNIQKIFAAGGSAILAKSNRYIYLPGAVNVSFQMMIVDDCAAGDGYRWLLERTTGADTLRISNETALIVKALCKTS